MQQSQPTETLTPKSLLKIVVKGGLWVFALRIINRSLGFVRTIILARLLSPDDFGLFGIAMLAISTLENFSQTGFQAALVQKQENVESFLDTAWTVSVLRGIILFLILVISAPLFAKFFNTPQATLVVKVIAIYSLLTGFRNIGVVFFQKELEFNKQFSYEFSATLVDLTVAITLAFCLRNVWALVWGGIAANSVRLFMSFIIHPYRPRIQFNKGKFQELFSFGKWVLGSNILIFFITQGDDIFVGKILGVSALGLYQMAYLLSNLPATEITRVISQVTFPAYSKLQDDLSQLRTAFLKVLRMTAFLSFPLAGGIFVFAMQFTRIFFGEKWLPIVPAVQVLCVFGVSRSLGATMGPILDSLGRPEIQTRLSSIQLFLMAAVIYPLTLSYGIVGTSIAVVIPNIVALILITMQTKKMLDFEYKDFFMSIFTSLIAMLVMCCFAFFTNTVILYENNIYVFMIIVFSSFIIYLFGIGLIDRPKFKTINTIREIFDSF